MQTKEAYYRNMFCTAWFHSVNININFILCLSLQKTKVFQSRKKNAKRKKKNTKKWKDGRQKKGDSICINKFAGAKLILRPKEKKKEYETKT